MPSDWLADFVEFSGYGEVPPKILYWVGVCTIAGALRRKVWIDQVNFQWTPNFYLLIVGPPGGPKKSTAIGMGMRFLRNVPGIDFGPQIVTWQQLITHMAQSKVEFQIDDEIFPASCVTISLSEFGSFFDPANRELVDNLTDIWDGKLGVIKKETKTNGTDEIINPWLNIMAGTTPGWVADNFTSKLVRSGFASRPVFLYEASPAKDIAYPSRHIPDCSLHDEMADNLQRRLIEISELAGEFRMTEESYRWGEAWYESYRNEQRNMGSQTEAGFYERKQGHLHKLAMVISASRGKFPTIGIGELQEADQRLRELEPDVRKIFGFVGQTRLSSAASDIMDIIEKKRQISKRDLYKRYFFRTMSNDEFEQAFKSVQACGLIQLAGPLDDLQICLKES